MAKFEITAPDGKRYEVEADTVDKANADLKAFRQQQVSQQQASDIEASPAWTRLFVAAHDLGRGAIDNLTLGGFSKLGDKLAGDDSVSMSTQAAKNRTGWAGTALDIATAAKYIPTAVPRVVGAVGGGPGVRSLVGTGVAGAEGAVVGGLDAAAHGQDIGQSGLVGGIGGAVGQKAGELIGSGVNKVAKWWKGAKDDLPVYNIRDLSKNPNPQQRVNVATTRSNDRMDLAEG